MGNGKRVRFWAAIIAAVVLLACAITAGVMLLPKKYYHASDFGLTDLKSPADGDRDGIDDYRDILLGARKDAENKPKYDGKYFEGGYPPDDMGVCTDEIWRAFREAGYDLKAMVDADIAAHPDSYPRASSPDPNIDFRRVPNLLVFFQRYGQELTLDHKQIAEWQPGDIVIFNNTKHIGILSDKRNKNGLPWLLHNGGQSRREEDYMVWDAPTAHFRFDASKVPQDVLKYWKQPES